MKSVVLPNCASYLSCHRRRRGRIPLLTAARLLGVFTRTPLIGNPLAIFTDARCLTRKCKLWRATSGYRKSEIAARRGHRARHARRVCSPVVSKNVVDLHLLAQPSDAPSTNCFCDYRQLPTELAISDNELKIINERELTGIQLGFDP